MVIALFAASLVLAFGISYGVANGSRHAVEAILNRFLARSVSEATAKYLQFAVVLAGISSGARIRLLEDFVGAPAWNKPEISAHVTQDVWALALYHTFIESLEGIAWLLLLFAFLVLTGVVMLRRSKITWMLSERERVRLVQADSRVIDLH